MLDLELKYSNSFKVVLKVVAVLFLEQKNHLNDGSRGMFKVYTYYMNIHANGASYFVHSYLCG